VNAEQASSDCQPKGVRGGRADHVAAKATDSVVNRRRHWTPPGYWRRHGVKEWWGTRETLPGSSRWAKTERIRGRPKANGARRESEGFVVPGKAVKAAGGKGPCFE
jgi:hypothetical protein